jgi:hypothetical protein
MIHLTTADFLFIFSLVAIFYFIMGMWYIKLYKGKAEIKISKSNERGEVAWTLRNIFTRNK